MPLQNRVTPFGDIVAIPQRGLFTGNRGIIHDPHDEDIVGKTLGVPDLAHLQRDFKRCRRNVMAGRSWKERFFLDEAVVTIGRRHSHGASWFLTPPSTVMALIAGYQPALHPSINPVSNRP